MALKNYYLKIIIPNSTQHQLIKEHLIESISQKVFDDAKVEYDVANENLISSKAKLNELNIQKSKKTIKAPYSGVIVEKNINLDEWLNQGSQVATM